MQELWYEFCEKYDDILYKIPLVIILKAFWYYENRKDVARDILYEAANKAEGKV